MLLFKTSDIVQYRHRLLIGLEILPLTTAFTEQEKATLIAVYSQILAICDTAIARDIEVKQPELI